MLRILHSLLFVLIFATAAVAGQSACPGFFAGGQSPDLLNQKLAPKLRELCNEVYEVGHSGVTRTPLWAAEHLTRNSLAMAKGLPRSNDFRADPRLPANERAELRDYARSGYDRGHMANAADACTASGKDETFYLSNMIPQIPANNRNIFEAIESAVRYEAKRRGELYVLTGPVFQGAQIKALKGRVLVPTAIYKAVYDPARGEAGAYLLNNEATDRYDVVSLSELERVTGIDLFPALSRQVKDRAMRLPAPRLRRPRR